MRSWITATSLVLLLLATPASAITNSDVIDNMSEVEAHAYVAATVEAYAFMSALNGNDGFFHCAMNWFFRTERTPTKIAKAMAVQGDKPPQATIFVLLSRQCGDPRGSGK